MAINYTPVGWDTSKYVNPTNMNQMDDGIKAACDKADANEKAIEDVITKLDGVLPLLGDTDISEIGDGTATGAISELNNNLNNKIKVTAITGSTGSGGGSGLLSVPRTDYPNAIAIIPFGYDYSFSYHVGAYDISSENFKFGVQLAVSGAWAENVTIVFKALVFE